MLWEGSRDGLGFASSLQEPCTAAFLHSTAPSLGINGRGEGASWRAVVCGHPVITVVISWDGGASVDRQRHSALLTSGLRSFALQPCLCWPRLPDPVQPKQKCPYPS